MSLLSVPKEEGFNATNYEYNTGKVLHWEYYTVESVLHLEDQLPNT